MKKATLSSITPSSSSADGGTIVTVAGTNFVKSASLICVFGTTRAIARFLSSNTLECSVPSSDSVGLVAFSLSGWGSYLAKDSGQDTDTGEN